MTIYRLPSDLGGGVVTEVEHDPAFTVDGHPGSIVRTSAGTTLAIRTDRLIGMPLEPEAGAVVMIPVDGPPAFLMIDRVFQSMGGGEWQQIGSPDTWSWADICELGTPVQLRPHRPGTQVSLCRVDETVGADDTDPEDAEVLRLWEELRQWLRMHTDWAVTVNPWGMYGCTVVELHRRKELKFATIGTTLRRRLVDVLAWINTNVREPS